MFNVRSFEENSVVRVRSPIYILSGQKCVRDEVFRIKKACWALKKMMLHIGFLFLRMHVKSFVGLFHWLSLPKLPPLHFTC